MPFFSKLKPRGGQAKKATEESRPAAPVRRHFDTQWNSTSVVLEEVEELIHACTVEMKSRAEALDTPFLLLPFRPDSDASGVRTFIASFFRENMNGSSRYRGNGLKQELRLTDPIVLCCIMKWCWSRIPRGVVSWPVYDGFAIGERESHMARNAFDTFIPIGVESSARKNIIFDFFDLISAVAAHGKMNGLGGRKLSRLAGWWAFEHSDNGNGFEGGYQSWSKAADATSHLFFAYLRSLSPEADASLSLIERIPRSLQALLAQTEYPPEAPALLQRSTPRVIMLVDSVSPTPFALLRRGAHFEYRSSDRVLHSYQEFEDPLNALTEECKRVLYAIASINSSGFRRPWTGGHVEQPEESWSAFQNLGFSEITEPTSPQSQTGSPGSPIQGLQSAPLSRNADFGRPTTPSWADFMSSGFADDENTKATPLLFPPEKILPPLGDSRAVSPMLSQDDDLAPGELAAITNVELDDAFWWVWITSLAGEEPNERKSVFGRCAIIETSILNGSWLIMEEQVKGASPDPAEGAILVEKKSRLSRLTSKTRLGRKSTSRRPPLPIHEGLEKVTSETPSKASIGIDQQAKIKAAARALTDKANGQPVQPITKRGRIEDSQSGKTNSVLTLGLQNEAGPAMKWATSYDKHIVRSAYLGDNFAGKGVSREELVRKISSQTLDAQANASLKAPAAAQSTASLSRSTSVHDGPAVPAKDDAPAVPADLTSPNPVPAEDTAIPPPAASPVTLPVQKHATPAEHGSKALPPISTATAKEVGISPPSPKIERKPLPTRTGAAQDHPAFRQTSEDTPQPQSPSTIKSPAALAAQAAMQGSPESQKSQAPSSIFRKQSSSAGLKKLFGRKKDSLDASRPQSKGLGESAQEVVAEPTMPSEPILDDITPQEHQDAEKQFSTFDQGPMEDMPAAMPVSSMEDTDGEANESPSHLQAHAQPASPAAGDGDTFTTPMEQLNDPVDDDQSEASIDDLNPIALEQDRWAQIRQNAQMRQRASEEQSAQSRPTQDSFDEGETSGEETIESRVARIKARVAELTGGV
ncbi:DUF1708-domain-containing protein, partial [Polychaeton citri CBS 116435]